MPCDECEKLQKAEAYALRSLQELRYINRQWGNRGKAAKQGEQDLERAYKMARAKTRLYNGECHQDEGHKVTIEGIEIVFRDGPTKA
jgi:hypothetical protein